ncbi:MAG: hypothetical protein QOH20_164 [Mycobacterium sp.]|nr:hypothetical protein [Mycobacterium sp.]
MCAGVVTFGRCGTVRISAAGDRCAARCSAQGTGSRTETDRGQGCAGRGCRPGRRATHTSRGTTCRRVLIGRTGLGTRLQVAGLRARRRRWSGPHCSCTRCHSSGLGSVRWSLPGCGRWRPSSTAAWSSRSSSVARPATCRWNWRGNGCRTVGWAHAMPATSPGTAFILSGIPSICGRHPRRRQHRAPSTNHLGPVNGPQRGVTPDSQPGATAASPSPSEPGS